MRTQNEFDLVVLEEELDTVWPELDNVSGSVGVPNKVGLDSHLLVRIGGVTPQDVDNQLLLKCADLVDNFQGPRNGVNLIQADQGAANSAMQAHDAVVDHGSQRKPVKDFVNLLEDRVRLVWLLA